VVGIGGEEEAASAGLHIGLFFFFFYVSHRAVKGTERDRNRIFFSLLGRGSIPLE
jgi:hypothetical protein